MVGVWINHHDKNIYLGTWKFVGKRTINLVPYGEKIVFLINMMLKSRCS